MAYSKLKACVDCAFHSRKESTLYDHECGRFASMFTGETQTILCVEARSSSLPDGVALPLLHPDSANWVKPCGPDAYWFDPKRK